MASHEHPTAAPNAGLTVPIPTLGISLLPRAGPGPGARPPRSALEQAVVDIWRQVLPSPALSADSDFFELGGDSLMAMQIVARVRQVFEVGLDLARLLEAPTPAAMAALVEAALLQGRAPDETPLRPVDRGGPLPLSATQERLWFIHQMAPDSAAYHIASAVRLRGPFEPAALEAAFSEVVRRHEILRTTFHTTPAGEPRQVVGPPRPFEVAVVAVDGPGSAALALADQAAQQPFDLARGPLLRATAFRLAPEHHLVLIVLHHIIADAWSLGVLAREMLAAYQAARAGTPSALPPLPIQFGDYAAWQRAALRGPRLERELSAWREKLAGLPRLELPLDHPRPSLQTYHGALAGAALDPQVLRALRGLSQAAAATLSMVLQAAFQVLLLRVTGQAQLAVGLPIANRREVAVEGLIGPFVNTLILRADLSGDPTFRAALARVRQASLEAYAHQDLPFAQLVAALNPERSLSHGPLAQVMFNHINVPLPAAPLSELRGEYVELDRGAAQFDLTLTVLEARERLILEYNTDLFEPATAARLLRQYANLLRAVSANPDQRIGALPLLDEAERRQLLFDWNDTARPCPNATLAELFEAQAARAPAATALIAGEQTLSYAALNARANRVAHDLRRRGVGPGSVVGVRLARSFDQIAALLGVLKTGAAYLPLDPAYPPERLRQMEDLSPLPPFPALRSGISDLNGKGVPEGGRGLVVIGADDAMLADLTPLPPSQCGKGVPLAEGGLIVISADDPMLAPEEVETDHGRNTVGTVNTTKLSRPHSTEPSPPSPGTPFPHCEGGRGDRSAYLLYTSGTTGRPKAVIGTHLGAVNHCQWLWDTYPFAPGEVAAAKTSLNFVDAVVEIFAPLLAGVPLALIPEDEAQDPAGLVAALARHGATRVLLLPALLRAMLERVPALGARLPRLRLVALSGERLEAGLLEQAQAALPGVTLLNWYGSSEVAGDVTAGDVSLPRADGAVPLGRPLANTQVYVLDPVTLEPAPIGVAGEIFAGGAGLALGYHGQPALTAERFVPHPFSAVPGARLYRTGDRGRWLPDGNLLFLGRRDRQVKVRGVRVELDEVQAVLGQHPALAECALSARTRAGGAELAAYYVLRPSAAVTPAELRQYLAQRLPAALLPAWIVPLEALPRLPNGKLDDAALPDPSAAHDWLPAPGAAPRTRLERRLAELWAECLGLPAAGVHPFGVHDNFFELGGHSLLAASLFARLKDELGLDLPLAALFRAPTVAGLAAAIVVQGLAESLTPAGLSSLVALRPGGGRTPAGVRPPLFCAHPLGGGVGDYAALARRLHPQQPFYGLRAKGLDDDRYQSAAIEALAADYVAEIRALQPDGPYRLAGYSSGGLIAFEMARQLTAAGQAVALVALLDSYAPAAPGTSAARPAALLNAAASLLNVAAGLPHWLADLRRLERRHLLTRLRRWRQTARHGAASLTAADYLGAAELAALPARHRAFIEAHWLALAAYRPQPWAGAVTLFRAQAQALSRAADPDKGWRALALGGVEIREFPGSHRTLLAEPWVAGLARVVQARLDELEETRA